MVLWIVYGVLVVEALEFVCVFYASSLQQEGLRKGDEPGFKFMFVCLCLLENAVLYGR